MNDFPPTDLKVVNNRTITASSLISSLDYVEEVCPSPSRPALFTILSLPALSRTQASLRIFPFAWYFQNPLLVWSLHTHLGVSSLYKAWQLAVSSLASIHFNEEESTNASTVHSFSNCLQPHNCGPPASQDSWLSTHPLSSGYLPPFGLWLAPFPPYFPNHYRGSLPSSLVLPSVPFFLSPSLLSLPIQLQVRTFLLCHYGANADTVHLLDISCGHVHSPCSWVLSPSLPRVMWLKTRE